MSIIIDVVLVLIVAFSAWRGFKNGFIRGIFGILAIIIAIYGANLVAKTYSGEFTGMLEPFVSGVVDKALTDVLHTDVEPEKQDTAPADGKVTAADDTAQAQIKSVYEISYTAMRTIGLSESAAKIIAEKVGGEMDSIGTHLSSNLTGTLSDALAYIAVFTVAFILIAIIFAVIGNIFNLAFSIPGIESADKIIGLILGILKGLLIVFTLAVVVRYIGLLSSETVEKTTILKYILNVNPLANILGI